MTFLCISIIIFNSIVFFMRKMLKRIELYSVAMFGVLFSEIVDRFTDKHSDSTYYFFDPWFIEWQSLLVFLGIYPALTMMIINWYPYNKQWYKKVAYILMWSAFATLYEYLCLQAGFLNYSGWKLWYSTMLYPFLFSMLFICLKFVRWLMK